ncbi:MAG: biotin synthase BioB [bacterium]
MDFDKILKNAKKRMRPTYDEAVEFLKLDEEYFNEVLYLGGTVCNVFKGRHISTCTIVNAKSGKCSENCRFCAQSVFSDANIETWELQEKEKLAYYAKNDSPFGSYYGIVTSGRKLDEKEIKKIAETLKYFKKEQIPQKICGSFGILTFEELKFLKDNGLDRFHHNLEVSKNFFNKICTTHAWEERRKTIENAKKAGLSLCVGGIFGVGEPVEERANLIFEIAECNPDSVPLNFLVSIKGTPLEKELPFPLFDAVKVIVLARLAMPDKEIKIGGGRVEIFKDNHALPFLAGADSIITGALLTVKGMSPDNDFKLLKSLGFERKN